MECRTAEAVTYYNGKNIKTSINKFNESFVYTDPASGESDSITITLGDPLNQWIAAWMPSKGDELSAIINAYNWLSQDDKLIINCGAFTIDDLDYSNDGKAVFTIGAVSAPRSEAFSETENTKTWENVTIQQIANTISAKYGLSVFYDAEDITIRNKEQSKQTDSKFLSTLCDDYGLSLKVYNYKIVIFDRETYKKADSVEEIAMEDMRNIQWHTTLAGSYTGGEITYTDSASGDDIICKIGNGTRILKVNEKADSKSDAALKLKAAIEKANHNITTISCSTLGRPDIVATQCVTVTGFGKISGKYYINKKTDALSSSGYTSSFELSLVEQETDIVVIDAISRLVALSVITSPDYWVLHHSDIKYLDGLLINMSTRIRTNSRSSNINDVDTAIAKLTEEGVINSSEYWSTHINDLQYLPMLLINAANAL